jgi:hypothetical protein
MIPGFSILAFSYDEIIAEDVAPTVAEATQPIPAGAEVVPKIAKHPTTQPERPKMPQVPAQIDPAMIFLSFLMYWLEFFPLRFHTKGNPLANSTIAKGYWLFKYPLMNDIFF